MFAIQKSLLSIIVVRYSQNIQAISTHIHMTLKNVPQWDNSRATVGLCCLINRDFKSQYRISMVRQGSDRGHARRVEERVGGGQVIMDSPNTP